MEQSARDLAEAWVSKWIGGAAHRQREIGDLARMMEEYALTYYTPCLSYPIQSLKKMEIAPDLRINVSIESLGDAYMSCAMYTSAEAFYKRALAELGKKTWGNRKTWKRLWNKMMSAMHLQSEKEDV